MVTQRCCDHGWGTQQTRLRPVTACLAMHTLHCREDNAPGSGHGSVAKALSPKVLLACTHTRPRPHGSSFSCPHSADQGSNRINYMAAAWFATLK